MANAPLPASALHSKVELWLPPGGIASPRPSPIASSRAVPTEAGRKGQICPIRRDEGTAGRQCIATWPIIGLLAIQMLGAGRPWLREVSPIPTRCYCFLGYMAIRTSDPETRDKLAYASLLIREAHPTGAWLAGLRQGIQAAILGQRTGQ